MVTTTGMFSGFSVTDVEEAREFYGETLGLAVTVNEMGFLNIQLPAGGAVLVYGKPDHTPATFTILNLEVDDIDVAADELEAAGVTLLRYEGAHQDERGIARGRSAGYGPDIAWFTDPAGNVLSILH
ncbi:VOC family protein [Galbitalea soli]|uniref:VOC family protein n=1 Tax=Galbitalea soli TaxID=1268042 RepID=A0A7C9TQ28_9MICO|nr:VOC family protein [Galbitalea soli]NEM90641.1 VOC family protein [Galbitalea soli]NYJ31359.1 catechol 2,3-dioxygenase-like lactoylglutathione lyase family enzyme [Galbitalea soli]